MRLHRKDDVINLCEVKFASEEFVIDAVYEKELNHKAEVFRTETNTQKVLHGKLGSLSLTNEAPLRSFATKCNENNG